MKEYYLRNKNAGFLGNSPYWWAKDGKGYTAYILNAERFSEHEVKRKVSHDPDKWMGYCCDDVDKRLHLIFDIQDQSRLGTDEPCGWSGGYAEIPPPNN